MPAIPAPEKFDPKLEEWAQYMDRIQFFFAANHTLDKDKKSTFLSLLSREVYSTLCQLLSPIHPSTKTFSEIVEVLDKYFKPRVLIPVERLRFIKRKQEVNESIKDFVKALRHLSTNCNYGDAVALDNRLCEQFIYGIKDSKIQEKFLIEESLTLDEAIKIALAVEAADKGAQELKVEPTLNNVLFYENRPGTSHSRKQPSNKCLHCGYKNHKSADCKFKEAKCHKCGTRGHLASVCKAKSSSTSTSLISKKSTTEKSRSVNVCDVTLPEINGRDIIVNFDKIELNYANEASIAPIMLDIKINGKAHLLQLDTGAAVSIVSYDFYKKYLANCKLWHTDLVLSTLREKIRPLGKVVVDAIFKNKQAKGLELMVLDKTSVCLIGLPWVHKLDIINQLANFAVLPIMESVSKGELEEISKLLVKFPNLFSNKLGQFKNFKVKLSLKKEAVPKFFKARPIPFALKEAVESELIKLQEQEIISPIQHSEWAAPIVVLRKKNNTLRICGDYKVGVNPALNVDQYPLPVIEDIFAQLSGGIVFSKLDLTQAYQQLLLDDSAQIMLTINTHKGLFRVHRMPFGISPAPAIFQQRMDELLVGLQGVTCYLDDILITGKSMKEHFSNLSAVLSRLEAAGITLNKGKCEFLKNQVEYLGHIIDRNGLHASPSKVSGIVDAIIPQDVSQLRSFLGLVGYYRKFLPNLSTVLTPLHKLLMKDSVWHWSKAADAAFQKVKAEIISTKVLTHFDPKLPISLACDASPTGIGAVISHIWPDSSERPIAFASRSLTTAEKNYSQLDKEALGILFGVKKFHQYLYGRKFTLLTDHKPLTRILGPYSEIPTLAAARLQRWALTLSAYTYEIVYRTSRENANADALSRIPASSSTDSMMEEEGDNSLLIANLDSFPVNDKMIAKETMKDPILSQVCIFVRDGWPSSKITKDLELFKSKSEELTLQDGCLLWGLRVIIPTVFRSYILQELHRHHTGIVRMKMLARSYIWWPNLDQDIQNEVKSCAECVLHANIPAKAPIHPWIWPTRPWERLHVDFAGPFMGKYFMIAVDAHSKWPEVIPMNSITSEITITALSGLFARYGLPVHLVSDNGTQFTSQKFKDFTKMHGIRHSYSSPYHPASNGQAERFVQTFKRQMRKKNKLNASIEDKVHQFLYAYRTTPHVTTRQTPAFLFLGRQLRTRLDLLRPSVEKVVRDAQDRMVLSRKQENTKVFQIGQKVIAREYLSTNKWVLGIILKQLGPVTYQIKLSNGKTWKRHIDQIRNADLIDLTPDVQETADNTTTVPMDIEPSDKSFPAPGLLIPKLNEPERDSKTLETEKSKVPFRNRRRPVRFR